MENNKVGPAAGSTGNMGKGSRMPDPGMAPGAGGGNGKTYSPKPNHGVNPGQVAPVKNDVMKSGVLPSKK